MNILITGAKGFVGKNLVFPFIIVVMYCLMIGVASFVLCSEFSVESGVSQVLLTAALISFPIVLTHFAYPYIALTYSLSFLMVVLGVVFARNGKLWGLVAAVLCFVIMLGSYQAYIGAVSALALIAFMLDLVQDRKPKNSLLDLLKVGVCGIVAVLIHYPLSLFFIKLYHTGVNERVGFSLKSVFENLGFSLKYGYVWFFSYFFDDRQVLSNDRLYAVLFFILGVLIILSLIKLFKSKRILSAVLIIVSALLMPLFMNLCLILLPENGMRDILRYQYVLLFVLLFALHANLGTGRVNTVLKYVSCALVFLFVSTYSIRTNATGLAYKILYNYSEGQAQIMMDRVYELEGYKINETPVVISAPFDYSSLYQRYPMIFRYAVFEGGPVLWGGSYGTTVSRYNFFFDYLGIDTKDFSVEEYFRIVDSAEFAAMPVWPAEGSVAMIDGHAVIKNSEEAAR